MDKDVKLPADLSIACVGDLQAQLLTLLGRAESSLSPVLDASCVENADSAGVQILVAFDKCLQARAQRLVLREPSRALTGACHALGLSGWMASTQTATAGA